MIYDDIYDAKNAVDHLSGFNVAGERRFGLGVVTMMVVMLGRYLVCLYYSATRLQKKLDAEGQKEEIERLKREHNIG